MQWLSVLFFLSFLQASLAAVIPNDGLINRRGDLVARADKPSQGGFYTPPPGWETDFKLGEVIRSQKGPGKFGVFFFPENFKESYQLLVRSEDTFGNPTAIVTTIFVPYNANSSRILSYQTAVDSASIDCAPSYAMQIDSSPFSWVLGSVEQLFAQGGLRKGWYVVFTDYLGPKASFGAGFQAAHATLDALKAVVSSHDLIGVDPNAEITLWGYSGGSQPTVWATALAENYAPDLNIIGAAAGGILIDPTHIAKQSFDGIFSGLIISAINGLSHEYPELDAFLKKTLKPAALSNFERNNQQCLLISGVVNVFKSWNDLSDLGIKILDQPIVKNVTGANNLLNLNHVPKVPLLFYNSKPDEIIPASDADKLYDQWCAADANILYRQDIAGEHVIQAVTGSGFALDWLTRRFNGETQQGCTADKNFSNLKGGVLSTINLIIGIIKNFLGFRIGPSKFAQLYQVIVKLVNDFFKNL